LVIWAEKARCPDAMRTLTVLPVAIPSAVIIDPEATASQLEKVGNSSREGERICEHVFSGAPEEGGAESGE
jgi:hypothetical protein